MVSLSEFMNTISNSENINLELLEQLVSNAKVVQSNMIGIEDIKSACKIINSPIPSYADLVYFFPTENLRYIGLLNPNQKESAFTITGSGNSILELVNQGFKKIVTTDTNPFNKHILRLILAAFKTLSSKDYDKFLLNYEHDNFLSKDVFNVVKEAINDEASINFWDCILINDKEDLLKFFFKPISSDYSHIKYGLPFLKKYYEIRERLDSVDIEIHTKSALEYLKKHPEQKFDYIDITNILLFVFQLECEFSLTKYDDVLKLIDNIYDINLKDGGVFVFDYFFGTSISTLFGESDLLEASKNAYTNSYNHFVNNYDLEILGVEKIVNLEEKDNDTVLYSKKIV